MVEELVAVREGDVYHGGRLGEGAKPRSERGTESEGVVGGEVVEDQRGCLRGKLFQLD